jgi:hypothetical protein
MPAGPRRACRGTCEGKQCFLLVLRPRRKRRFNESRMFGALDCTDAPPTPESAPRPVHPHALSEQRRSVGERRTARRTGSRRAVSGLAPVRSVLRTGWPRVVADPRLPQTRTCSHESIRFLRSWICCVSVNRTHGAHADQRVALEQAAETGPVHRPPAAAAVKPLPPATLNFPEEP